MFPNKLTHILELLDTQYLGQEQTLYLKVCKHYNLQPAPESTAAAATATTEEAADAHRQVPVDTIMDGTQSEDTFSRSSQNSTAARAQSQHPMRPRPTIASVLQLRQKGTAFAGNANTEFNIGEFVCELLHAILRTGVQGDSRHSAASFAQHPPTTQSHARVVYCSGDILQLATAGRFCSKSLRATASSTTVFVWTGIINDISLSYHQKMLP